MPDPTARLRYYRETGQTELAQKYEQYLRETGQLSDESALPPNVKVVQPKPIEPDLPSKVAGSVASVARDIPGVEAVAAFLRSKVRGQPYAEALSDIHGAEDAAPAVVTAPARFAGAGLASAALPGGAALKGAQFGALTGALSSDPNSDMTSRAIGAGAGAATGAIVGRYTGKLAEKLAPTAEKASDAIITRLGGRAAIRPAIRLANGSVPKAEGFIGNGIDNLADAATEAGPRGAISRVAPLHLEPAVNAEGFIGNAMDNVAEAASGAEPAPITPRTSRAPVALDVAPETEAPVVPIKDWKPRSRTKAQFQHFAEQFAQHQAEEAAQRATSEAVSETPLEDLLRLSLGNLRQGGSLRAQADVIRALRPPTP